MCVCMCKGGVHFLFGHWWNSAIVYLCCEYVTFSFVGRRVVVMNLIIGKNWF